jgi:hypothetical protein
MENPITKYAIYFDYKTLGDRNGKKSLEAVTNNPEKWLQEHNESRIADGNEPEELDDFIIEELYGEIIYED